MSPILVRPVREQLEHDRLVRFLNLKYKRKFEVALNMGDEQVAPVKIGALTLFPDLVLTVGKKLAGVVEVESGESVNNLEAMAQWVHFSRSRVPFHLYVPIPSYETARRLCQANQANVTEIWTYRPAADGFDLVRVGNDAPSRNFRPAPRPQPPARPAISVVRPATQAKATVVVKPVAKPPAKPPAKAPVKAPVKGSAKAPVKSSSAAKSTKPSPKSARRPAGAKKSAPAARGKSKPGGSRKKR